MKNEVIPGFCGRKTWYPRIDIVCAGRTGNEPRYPRPRVSLDKDSARLIASVAVSAPARVIASTLYPGIRLVPGLLQQEIRVYRQTAFF